MLPIISGIIAMAEGYGLGTVAASVGIGSTITGITTGFVTYAVTNKSLKEQIKQKERVIAALQPAEQTKEERLEYIEELETQQQKSLKKLSSDNEKKSNICPG